MGKSLKTAVGFSIHLGVERRRPPAGTLFSSLAVLALVLQDAGIKKTEITLGFFFFFLNLRGEACEKKNQEGARKAESQSDGKQA